MTGSILIILSMRKVFVTETRHYDQTFAFVTNMFTCFLIYQYLNQSIAAGGE